MTDDDPSALWIEPTPVPHEPARIVGDEAGLKKLKRAVRLALVREDEAGQREVCSPDGEGYELVEAASPGRYLELFAREEREGREGWGNELTPEK